MNILGTLALGLVALTALMVFVDAMARSQSAAYVTVAAQMQYHTQRLAKASSLAARGRADAFAQVQDSRDEFASYLKILQEGGFAFGVDVPSAATTDELKSRLEELGQRWPDSSKAASAILPDSGSSGWTGKG